jgi:hypothetical protein
LNEAVLLSNEQSFPVRLSEVEKLQVENTPDATLTLPSGRVLLDPVHCVMTDKTRLNWLADNFRTPEGIESVGDGLLDLSKWTWGFVPFVWAYAVLSKLKKED